jgi:F0F1-type ATP synthase assembly protein I
LKRSDDDRSLARYLRYSHLGIQFLVSIALPLALGIWLDRRWGTKVLFTLLGLAVGFAAALYSLYGELYRKRNDDDRKPGGPDGSRP